MNKGFWVGVGSIATGLVSLAIIRFIIGPNISPTIVAVVMVMMVIFASQQAYKLGKKDGASAAQKGEQDRTEGGEES